MSAHADKVRASIAADADTSVITTSWRRCLRIYRLDPDLDVAPRAARTMSREARARASILSDIARPCLDQLYAMLADTDCAVFLTDELGMLLEVRTTRAFDVWNRAPDQWLGAPYSEARLGTNAIGTGLVEQRAMIVRGDQHFLTRLSNRVGISVPLFGPDGTLSGCLALNQRTDAHDARFDSFLSISLANFARRIEVEMFARAHPSMRLVLASPNGHKPHALLAVDEDDRVVGATRSARRLLALGDDVIAAAPGTNEVFETRRSCSGDILADLERRAIQRAMMRCNGNLSAAARAIGISRSTLYRKLTVYGIAPQVLVSRSLRPRPSA